MVDQTPGERLFHEVKTLEQAQKYMSSLVDQVERARKVIDELERLSRIGKRVPRETLEKAYRNLCIRYGQALGSLVTLMHTRVLTDEAYNQFRVRVDLSMVPKVVAVL